MAKKIKQNFFDELKDKVGSKNFYFVIEVSKLRNTPFRLKEILKITNLLEVKQKNLGRALHLKDEKKIIYDIGVQTSLINAPLVRLTYLILNNKIFFISSSEHESKIDEDFHEDYLIKGKIMIETPTYIG